MPSAATKTSTKNVLSSAIVVAAGSSSRMGGKVRKPFLELRRKPILSWTLCALAKISGLQELVIVTRPDDRHHAIVAVKLARLPRKIKIVYADGGARRQDSVYNGLKASNKISKLVLIHDAARPFPPADALASALTQAHKIGASILAVRVKDTVKRECPALVKSAQTPLIESTLPRAGLWLAQTPQVFRRALILKLFGRLFRERPTQEVTDDASICELFQQPVALIESSEMNFKVTRPEDIFIAETYLLTIRW